MRLAHVSLAVTELERSRQFYEARFGFACSGVPDAEGCLHLTDAGGFDLTLAPAASVAPSGGMHLGVAFASADAVRRSLAELTAAGVRTGDLYESDARVAFHCWDPDGHQVEVFWAAQTPSSAA